MRAGADLENMVNQAALKAAMDGASTVAMQHFDFARDKVIMGEDLFFISLFHSVVNSLWVFLGVSHNKQPFNQVLSYLTCL